jgi:hypothetical protein
MSSQPFRFLELPTELRFMVYEQTSPISHTHILNTHDGNGAPVRTSFTRQSLPVSLLSTSRQIAYEAQPFFVAKFAALRNQPIHFSVADTVSGSHLIHEDSRLIFGFGAPLHQDFFDDLRAEREEAAADGDNESVTFLDTYEREQRIRTAAIEAHVTAEDKVFGERSAKMLAWVSMACLTPQRQFDIEIRPEKDIAECGVAEMTDFLMDVNRMSFEMPLAIAIAIVGTGLEDANSAGGAHITESRVWRGHQARHARDFDPGHRPCLRLVDAPPQCN